MRRTGRVAQCFDGRVSLHGRGLAQVQHAVLHAAPERREGACIVSADADVEHGIGHAAYAGGPGEPYFQPYMECLCGWSTGRCDSWQSAGEELDEHLAEVKP